MRDAIAPEVLRQLLRYEPETGKLFWKERGPEWFRPGNTTSAIRCKMWNQRYANTPALTNVNPFGHHRGAVLDVGVLAHRVAWAIHTGHWPDAQIDHINGVPSDNRIANLREVTPEQNKANAGKRPNRNPESSFIGVCRVKSTGRWTASVGHGGRNHHAGTFPTEKEAAVARDHLAIALKGEFARLNFPEANHA